MKYLLIILLSSCASASTQYGVMDKKSYNKLKQYVELRECIAAQADTYGDMCFESSIGYEDMNGTDAYAEGLLCATDGALACLKELKR